MNTSVIILSICGWVMSLFSILDLASHASLLPSRLTSPPLSPLLISPLGLLYADPCTNGSKHTYAYARVIEVHLPCNAELHRTTEADALVAIDAQSTS